MRDPWHSEMEKERKHQDNTGALHIVLETEERPEEQPVDIVTEARLQPAGMISHKRNTR